MFSNGGASFDEELEQFVTSSHDVVELKFVQNYDDFNNNSLIFRPVYTHQVFENEKVFGYKDLKIKLYYTPDTLDTYINISFTDSVAPLTHKGTTPDNIMKALLEWIPQGFITNEDEYVAKISEPHPFTPFGELLHVHVEDDTEYEIYKVNLSVQGFVEYLNKLQTFIIWFIEAGSFIDTDDDNWSFYLMYQKKVEFGVKNYSIIGYSSVYCYYAYPDRIRPRISQMLILPPYQRRGLGGVLLQTIYSDLITNNSVLDITVEDPSTEFTALRDYIDCSNALKLSIYSSKIIPDYSKDIEEICRQKLKINKSRRIYEILKLRATDKNDSLQYHKYRLFVKNRLNGPYKKQQNDLDKLQKLGSLDQVELVSAVQYMSVEERMKVLHEEYTQLENDYTSVIEKLATIV